MALFDRLIATDGTKVPVRQFMAAMQELARGQMTKAEIVAAFALDAADVVELDQVIARYQTKTAALDKFAFAHALHDILMLAEAGLRYTTRAEVAARILSI